MRNRNSRLSLAVLLACAVTVGACSCDGGSGGGVGGDPKWRNVLPDPDKKADILIDFGAVGLNVAARKVVEVSNVGTAALRFDNFTVPAPFRVEPSSFTLGVNESKEVTFIFQPSEVGEKDEVATLKHQGGETTFRLKGKGVEPRFDCTPLEVDFGYVENGSVETREVVCVNNTELTPTITVTEPRGNHASSFKAGENLKGGNVRLEPGTTITIPVEFSNVSGTGRRTADFGVEADGEEVAVIKLVANAINDALVAEPSCGDGGLDFGYVQPGARAQRTLVLRNVGTKPIGVQGLKMESETSWYRVLKPNGFTLEPDDPSTTEVNEGEIEIPIEFAPLDFGSNSDRVLIARSDGKEPIGACVRGVGGGPLITCTPETTNFDKVAVGAPRTRRVICWNSGSDDTAEPVKDNLFITNVDVENDGVFSAKIVNEDGTEGAAATGYVAGQQFFLDITYDPTQTNFDTTTITIHSNDSVKPEYTLTANGNGVQLEPCEFSIVPEQLRFGIVRPGESATLDFAVRNEAAHECLIYNVRAVTDGDVDVYSTEAIEVLELPPNGEVRIKVTFTPPSQGSTTETVFTGKVLFEISNPSTPNQEVPLTGASMESCVELRPSHIDFGTAQPMCQSRVMQLEVVNGCESPVYIRDVIMNEGPSCTVPTGGDPTSECLFGIVQKPVLPSDPIPSGDRKYLGLVYQPEEEGEDWASIFVYMNEEATPYMATLYGRASHNAVHTDVFEQAKRPKVDMLWIIDDSGSMCDDQQEIADELPYLLSFAIAEQVDFQIGVTTSDVPTYRGRLWPYNVNPPGSEPRWLTPFTPNLEDRWETMINRGCNGDATERLLEAARLALELAKVADDPNTSEPLDGNLGFIRHDAALSIVFVSDEPDDSIDTGYTVPDYLAEYEKVKGRGNKDMLRIHGLLPDPSTGCEYSSNARYLPLIEATNGYWAPICTDDWSETLEKIGTAAFGFNSQFNLTGYPQCDGICDEFGDPPDIIVVVDGVEQPSTYNGDVVWRYHPLTNAIEFNPLYRPAPGVQVEVTYRVQCLGGGA